MDRRTADKLLLRILEGFGDAIRQRFLEQEFINLHLSRPLTATRSSG
jgi:hypothetical protein